MAEDLRTVRDNFSQIGENGYSRFEFFQADKSAAQDKGGVQVFRIELKSGCRFFLSLIEKTLSQEKLRHEQVIAIVSLVLLNRGSRCLFGGIYFSKTLVRHGKVEKRFGPIGE